MIDTAIACHTPIDALMQMSVRRFTDIRGALRMYRDRIRQEREEEQDV